MLTITTSGLTPRLHTITAALTADRTVISDAGMREACVRVRAALACLPPDLAPPTHLGITASAPGLRPPGCDLAVALAALVDAGSVPASYFEGVTVLGELSLGGGLRGVRGVAAMLQPESPPVFAKAIVPHANEAEARAAARLAIRVGACKSRAVDSYGIDDHVVEYEHLRQFLPPPPACAPSVVVVAPRELGE